MIIRTETGLGHTVAQLVGRFDAHEVQSFRLALEPLASMKSGTLKLDLSQVAFVDSTALAELVRLHKNVVQNGGQLVLVNLSDPVRVILEITDLAAVFVIETPEVDLT